MLKALLTQLILGTNASRKKTTITSQTEPDDCALVVDNFDTLEIVGNTLTVTRDGLDETVSLAGFCKESSTGDRVRIYEGIAEPIRSKIELGAEEQFLRNCMKSRLAAVGTVSYEKLHGDSMYVATTNGQTVTTEYDGETKVFSLTEFAAKAQFSLIAGLYQSVLLDANAKEKKAA